MKYMIILLGFLFLSCEAILPPSSSNMDYNIVNPFTEIEITFDGKYYDIVSKSATPIIEVHADYNGTLLIMDTPMELDDNITLAHIEKWWRYSILTITKVVQ